MAESALAFQQSHSLAEFTDAVDSAWETGFSSIGRFSRRDRPITCPGVGIVKGGVKLDHAVVQRDLPEVFEIGALVLRLPEVPNGIVTGASAFLFRMFRTSW
jgi:hypothetical protein